MNIVIAGVGGVGFHLAELLAIENQNITVVDLDEKLLEYVSSHLDVLAIRGDVTSLQVLEDAQVNNAHLFIAATTNEAANLLAAILAKRLGAKQTIARVNKVEYLEESTKQYFYDMGIDNLVSPQVLAAQEIERLIHRSSATDIFEFDDGLISILGFTIDNSSPIVNKTFEELDAATPDFLIKTICLLRNGKTIVPKGNTRIIRSDHVYLVTNNQDFAQVNDYIGKTLRNVKKIMIIGGGAVALLTAKILEKNFTVTMVVREEDRCKKLLDELNNTLIINGDWTNIDLLKEEGLESTDAFIALTDNSEANIINCITAEQAGVYKTIALVDNSAYTHVSLDIGVDTLINKKLIAANNIFRYVRKGRIEAIASLHGVNAEIIEFEIHKKNRVVRVPLKDLHLPPDGARIIGIVREGVGIVPDDSFQLQVGDKAIVFALHEATKRVENIFR